MSILLSNSPFKNTFPCIHVSESDHNLKCILYGCNCNLDPTDCNRFQPVNPSEMSILDKCTVPIWKLIVEDTDTYSIEYYKCSNCNSDPPKDKYGQEYLSRYCPNCGEYLSTTDGIVDNVPLGKYQHYKGNIYDVIGIAKHTEQDILLVIYKNVHNSDIYARPLEAFLDIVEDVNLHYRGPRFYKIS